MSFSQSLSLGENTLCQLDICEEKVNNVNNNKDTELTTSISSRTLNGKSKSVNIGNESPIASQTTSNKGLEIIEESPTEKINVLGKSIRERLKNVSSSKKSDYKSMRRSRSDPIKANNTKHMSSQMHGFSEDMNIIFDDSTFVTDEMENRTQNKKSKIKLDEKFEQDDFEKLFGNIQTPKLYENEANIDTKNTSLIPFDDSDELGDVDISEVERLMRTENIEKTVNEKIHNESANDIEWEDSAYFNDLLASQQNELNIEPKQIEESLADIVVDTEHVSMQSCQNDGIDDELESCFLEVSVHLTNLNASENKAIPKIGTQLDTSVFSRSISEAAINEINEVPESAISVLNSRCIDNLKEWNCTQSIIKAYKKKGINEMFEWQAECLNNPKVTLILIQLIASPIFYFL